MITIQSTPKCCFTWHSDEKYKENKPFPKNLKRRTQTHYQKNKSTKNPNTKTKGICQHPDGNSTRISQNQHKFEWSRRKQAVKKNLKNNLGDDVITESEVGPAVPAAVDLPFQTHHKQPPHPSHKILNSKQISQPKKKKNKRTNFQDWEWDD